MRRRVRLTGKRFGQLEAIKSARTSTGRAGWLCRCDCGTTKVVLTSNLTTGRSRSCGACRASQVKEGAVFGKLRVVAIAKPDKNRNPRVRAICDIRLGGCGRTTTVLKFNLYRGLTTSCGCARLSSVEIGERFGLREVIAIKRLTDRTMVVALCHGCGSKLTVSLNMLKQGIGHTCRECSRLTNRIRPGKVLGFLEIFGVRFENGLTVLDAACRGCGGLKYSIPAGPVVSGVVISCGCYMRYKSRFINYKHGEWGTRLYQRAQNQRRRALIRKAEGLFDSTDITALYKDQGGRCYFCVDQLGTLKRMRGFEIDHLTPLSRGGSNRRSNLALTCMRCNRRKHDKTEEGFWIFLSQLGEEAERRYDTSGVESVCGR